MLNNCSEVLCGQPPPQPSPERDTEVARATEHAVAATNIIRNLSSHKDPTHAEAARRAIIRCGARGFELPPEKYEQWRDIEMTFDPERMRIK